MNDLLGLDRRKLFAGFIALGVIGLMLGGWRITQSIRAPFTVAEQNETETGASDTAALEALKTKDTDGDGLSDYQELYAYATSPYLRDSDSDQKSDQEELAAGTDPNCPAGKDCLGAGATNSGAATNGAVSSNSNAPGGTGSARNASPASAIDPALLRETLRNAGAPANVLDATSDAELLQLYQETVASSDVAASPTASLENLTADEVRQLLIENGADENELKKVDDASLMAIFAEALKEEQTK